MASKTCSVCTINPASFHTEGIRPSFFCGQDCASKVGQIRVQAKSVHHDVIDSGHPLHGFIKHNSWLAECIGETRADGSVKVTNRAAVQPLIDHILIGPKRDFGATETQTVTVRDPSRFEEAEKSDIVSMFEKMKMNYGKLGKRGADLDPEKMKKLLDERKREEAKKKLPSVDTPEKRGADVQDEEEEAKKKQRDDNEQGKRSYVWQIPLEVVSEILYAIIDYDLNQATPEFDQSITFFAKQRPEFIEFLSKLSWDQQKKVAFSIIKRRALVLEDISYYQKDHREMIVLGSLIQIFRGRKTGQGIMFWNMQEDGTGNTLLHYAIMQNYANLAQALYIYGASDTIPNATGKTAKDIAISLGRQDMIKT